MSMLKVQAGALTQPGCWATFISHQADVWSHAGFANFAFKYSQSWAKGAGKVALRNLAWWMGGAKLPCWKVSDSACYKNLQSMVDEGSGSCSCPVQAMPPVASLQQAPLVVMSHGMGGNRFCSSLLCCHLASQVSFSFRTSLYLLAIDLPSSASQRPAS